MKVIICLEHFVMQQKEHDSSTYFTKLHHLEFDTWTFDISVTGKLVSGPGSQEHLMDGRLCVSGIGRISLESEFQ